MKDKRELAEEYLKQRGFRKTEGFAINTQEMNPNDYDEILFDGKDLPKAIEDYCRKVDEYWIYEPSNGEQIFEDIWEAVEYAEENSDVSFNDFKKSTDTSTTKKKVVK